MNDVAEPIPSPDGLLAVPGPGLSLASDPGERAAAPSVSPEARFRDLVDRHFAFIWRSLRGLGVPSGSVDDAAQHVFLVVSEKLADIAPGSERAFLFSTAIGVASNARRSHARRREVLGDEVLDTVVDHAPNGEDLIQERERRALLDEVLAGMPDDLRVVFVLFVLEGLTAKTIAELLDLAPGTVASRLRRARELLHVLSKRVQARVARTGGAPLRGLPRVVE